MSFTQFAADDSVISSDVTISPMWASDNVTLTTFFTSSTQASSTPGKFYLDVYNADPSVSSTAEVQFSIAYGHISGSGSGYFNPLIPDKTPTRDIYGQFRSLIFGDENTPFTFGSDDISKDIIVISINRARFKESFNPGSLTLTLTTGSHTIKLTDDSTVNATATYIGTSRVYYLLSGSYDSIKSTTYTDSGSYGLMIPDEGLIILNPRALALSTANGGLNVTWNEFSSSQVATANPGYNYNNRKIFELLSSGASFRLQNYETITSRYFFVRVKNAENNYTTNPTVIDSNGNLLYTQLIYNPQTFITSVGLYNNGGELVAVAKLNKPLVKDFTKELLLRVKLDF